MMRVPKIDVAGAGALGLACALRLAQAGAKVRLFDPQPDGPKASSVAAGMLAPVFEALLDEAARPHFDVLTAARELWPAFAADFGLDLDRRGAMAVGDDERLASLEAGFRPLGVTPHRLTAPEAHALAPGLSTDFVGGLFTAEDWRIEAGPALAALRRAARGAGVEIVNGLARGGEGADLLVAATGASASLAPVAPELRRLSPIKGHILRFAGVAYAGTVVRGPLGYAAPAEGGLTVGATMEAGVDTDVIDPAQAAKLAAAGRSLFPALERAGPAEALSGVRAATADGLPLVGPSAARGVLLAAGARRNGWLLAPMVAQMVTAYAFGRDAGAWAQRMDPARFD